MNNLYGAKYIENQRSSGYKSTVYAMAEIVDNSVDANATKVDIFFSEKESYTGQRKRVLLNRIYFVDNGSGMAAERLNGCLTFAEGAGKSDKRIGSFGVGLPNSSISVCRKVEVYSRLDNGNWQYVCLDLDDQKSRTEPGYDESIVKEPNYPDLIFDDTSRTVIVWSKLDRLDVSRAVTLLGRCKKLLGRIYRYKFEEGLEINLFETSDDSKSIKKKTKVIPYDPLFLMSKENYITEHIWAASKFDDPLGRHKTLSHLDIFTSKYHYAKYIEGCKSNENKPLFQKFDDYWDVEYTSKFNGVDYNWKIKASFAYSDIANPGVRSGGGTRLGYEFGKKANGDAHFPSGNIFFIRAGREIDFGNFGLYTITEPKNRFWTIEIHFDSILDELMGLSNDKQSVKFKAITSSDFDEQPSSTDILPIGLQRELLWSRMTDTMKRAIALMKKHLAVYSSNFQELEKTYTEDSSSKGPTVPQVEQAVIQVIPKGEPWSEEQKREVAAFLKEKYMHISEDSIMAQVEQFAIGLTKTIVLYAPNETGNLFELKERKGKKITIINTNHKYYTNIIEPLKSDSRLKIFAISIELLISSFALEMDSLVTDNPRKFEEPLGVYLRSVSGRLQEFIHDSSLAINISEIGDIFVDDSEFNE
jgi:hypothetical protein